MIMTVAWKYFSQTITSLQFYLFFLVDIVCTIVFFLAGFYGSIFYDLHYFTYNLGFIFSWLINEIPYLLGIKHVNR
jgi:hypothetical protein